MSGYSACANLSEPLTGPSSPPPNDITLHQIRAVWASLFQSFSVWPFLYTCI